MKFSNNNILFFITWKILSFTLKILQICEIRVVLFYFFHSSVFGKHREKAFGIWCLMFILIFYFLFGARTDWNFEFEEKEEVLKPNNFMEGTIKSLSALSMPGNIIYIYNKCFYVWKLCFFYKLFMRITNTHSYMKSFTLSY